MHGPLKLECNPILFLSSSPLGPSPSMRSRKDANSRSASRCLHAVAMIQEQMKDDKCKEDDARAAHTSA